MNDLLIAFQENSFYPDNIIADGKIHRFKRNKSDKGKSAWYVAHQNYTIKTGEIFYVAIFGDWSESDDVYKYCSLKVQSAQEKKIIEEQIRKAERARIQEQERVWEECSIQANEIWPTLSSQMDSPYFERKKIANLYGTKTKSGVILVPVCDTNGKLWGLQKIFPDGQKFFMAGTKKRGNFHVLRSGISLSESNIIYICEGFATAASVHEASNENVVVCFDAWNINSVCESIRKIAPQAALVICGDDDRWTTKPDGTQWNPGREQATKAAEKFLGKAIFPSFKSLDGNPTDFNDLHSREGLDVVKEQILDIKTEKHYVVPLGHKNMTYYYSSNKNEQIIAIVGHSGDALLCLQPIEYWEQLYASKTGVDWQMAASVLKSQCHAKGIFNPQKVRGLGVWLDEGRVVVHLGNRLWVDGKEIRLHELKTVHTYVLEESQGRLVGNPLNNCDELLKAIHNMAWARKQDSIFFSGWLVAAMLSGVLQWRPHMWLIGGSGAGKSVTYEIIAKVMSGHVITLAGGTSEAGLRRSVRGSALPLIFDEFELNDNATMMENQKILAFMRQASSDSAAQIVKADGGQGVIAYQPRFCAFVAGIRPSFNNEADRNRFTLVELDRAKQNEQQWSIVKQSLSKIDEKYAHELFLRVLNLVPVFKENIKVFEKVLLSRHYSRFAQQFSPILAGYCLLISESKVSIEEAEVLIDSLELQNEVSDIRDQNDEFDAINQLLHSKIRCSDLGDRAILEVIEKSRFYVGHDSEGWNTYLQRYGLKIQDDCLFVSNKNPELSKIFDKTRFPINWNYSLSRITGAKKNVASKILGKTTRGVLLPLSSIV